MIKGIPKKKYLKNLLKIPKRLQRNKKGVEERGTREETLKLDD